MNKNYVNSIVDVINNAAWYDISKGCVKEKLSVVLYGDTAKFISGEKVTDKLQLDIVFGKLIITDNTAGSGSPREVDLTLNYFKTRLDMGIANLPAPSCWCEKVPDYLKAQPFSVLKKNSTLLVSLNNINVYLLDSAYELSLKPSQHRCTGTAKNVVRYRGKTYGVLDFAEDDISCPACGNDSFSDGFEPCNSKGVPREPNSGWMGWYVCGKCGAVYANFDLAYRIRTEAQNEEALKRYGSSKTAVLSVIKYLNRGKVYFIFYFSDSEPRYISMDRLLNEFTLSSRCQNGLNSTVDAYFGKSFKEMEIASLDKSSVGLCKAIQTFLDRQ